MKKRKQVKKTDRFSDKKKYTIPIGPLFQADVAEWKGPPQKKYPHETLDSSKWLGTVIWPNKDTNNTTTSKAESDVIGRGRPHRCDCDLPGDVYCINYHRTGKVMDLEQELGRAFRIWRFDEMGEYVSRNWKLSEQMRFGRIFKSKSEGNNNSMKLAQECFPSKELKTIVSFYFNVYLLREIRRKMREGCFVDSDVDEENMTSSASCLKGSRKRARVDGVGPTSKFLKTGYLAGRR